jgi:hypothetical protein
MYMLKVEELESRQLLTSAEHSFLMDYATASLNLAVSTHSLTTAEHSFLVDYATAERSFLVDYAAHAGAFDLGWSDGGGVGITLFRIIFSPNQGWRDVVLAGPAHQGPTATWLDLEGGDIRVGVDHFASRFLGAGGPTAALLLNGAVSPMPLDPPSSTRGLNAASAEAVFAILAGRTDSQPHLVSWDPGGGGGLPALVLGPAARRSLSSAIPVQEGASGVPGVLPEGGRGDSGFGASASIEHERGPTLPAPQLSEALPVLPPLDLSGLEVGIQEFLKELGRLTPYVAGDAGGTKLWPWVVALAAAATACEIARRELRKTGRFADGRNERDMTAEWSGIEN